MNRTLPIRNKINTECMFVHITTLEEYNSFMEILEKDGYIWRNSKRKPRLPDYFPDYKEDTCIQIFPMELNIIYFNIKKNTITNPEDKILSFSDFLSYRYRYNRKICDIFNNLIKRGRLTWKQKKM